MFRVACVWEQGEHWQSTLGREGWWGASWGRSGKQCISALVPESPLGTPKAARENLWQPVFQIQGDTSFNINFLNCPKETLAMPVATVPNIWMKVGGQESLEQSRVLICLRPGGSVTMRRLARFLKRPLSWERSWESKRRVLHTAGKCSHCVIWVSAGTEPVGLTHFFQL